MAFVVARDPGTFDPADVRAFITSHLAEWKVPARFQLIGKFKEADADN